MGVPLMVHHSWYTYNMTHTEATARQILADARDLHGDLCLFRNGTRKTTSPRGAMLIKQQIMDEKVKIWAALDTLRNLASAYRPQPPATVKIRCDQNRIFGCGRWNVAKVGTTPIGPGATGCHAFAWCACGLPLARGWTLYPRV